MQQRQIARVVAVPTGTLGHPDSETGHVFEMFVSLSDGAQLKTTVAPGQAFRARRLLKGVEIWSGRLLGEGDSWILQSDDDDDPIWFIKFGTLRPGEYLTLFPPGRTELVFRIVNVDYPSAPRTISRLGTSGPGEVISVLQLD